MRIDRYITTLSLSLFMVTIGWAQQTIDPTLEVDRNFDAKLLEISKGKLKSSFDDSIAQFNLLFNYSIFDRAIKNLYEFSPIPSAKIESTRGEKREQLYLKLGANWPLNPYGTLLFQPSLGERFSLLVAARHNSFLATLPSYREENGVVTRGEETLPAPSSKSDFDLQFKYGWREGEVAIKANHRRDHNSYYGMEEGTFTPLENSFMRDSLSHRANRSSLELSTRSLKRENNSFHYSALVGFSQLSARENHPPSIEQRLEENYLNLDLTMGAGFAKFNKIAASFKYEASNSYLSDSLDRSNLVIYPRYQFKKGRWDFDLGFTYNMGWSEGESRADIYLKSSAKLEIIREKLWMYGKVDGENQFLNYHKVSDINPWISPSIELSTISQPLIIEGGFKGRLAKLLTFELYGGYRESLDQLYFYASRIAPTTTKPLNSYSSYYADEKRFTVGGQLGFQNRSLEANLMANLYSYKDGEGSSSTHFYNTPFEIKAFGRYNWRERVVVAATILFKERTPILREIEYFLNSPSYTKIDLKLSYNYNKNFTFFIVGNNLLDATIVEYGSYLMPSINGGAGISIKF